MLFRGVRPRYRGIFLADSFACSINAGPGQPPGDDALDMPQFGATFVPGGYDDYYMPEVIAPAPQR